MTILNENKSTFNKVEYMEHSGNCVTNCPESPMDISETGDQINRNIHNDNSGAKWNSLCTNLKNNVCYKKVSFKTGNHSIIVRAADNAGNSDSESLNFVII